MFSLNKLDLLIKNTYLTCLDLQVLHQKRVGSLLYLPGAYGSPGHVSYLKF